MLSTRQSFFKEGRAARCMATQKQAPVRLVLFDVFDTLCTPRIPIHEQYHEEAIRSGICPESISALSIRKGFKSAFKRINAQHPLYGNHSQPPLKPEEWWTKVIHQTILHAGASTSEVDSSIDILAPRLLDRFESDRGYRNFPETLTTLRKLREMGVKTSVVSNADPRILKTLASLDILPLLSVPPTLSWDVEHPKPDAKIFRSACQACDEEVGEGVLMVGDELEADYRGAVQSGLEGRLIRRSGEWSDGAVRIDGEDLTGVTVISSLEEVVEEVRRRNGIAT